MKKKHRIKELTRQRDHARALACQYEEIVAEYRRIEPLRFSKRDVIDLSRASRHWTDSVPIPQPRDVTRQEPDA